MIDDATVARRDSPTDRGTKHAAADRSATEERTSATSKHTYTVRAGDSLYRIARRYGTKIGALRTHNNLSSDSLRIGQLLIIPKS